MTYGVLQVSAIALGTAALVSLSPLSSARADMSAPSGTTSATSGATSAPSPTPPTPGGAPSTPSGGATSTSGGAEPTGNAAASTGEAPTPPARPYPYAQHYTRHTHHVWRNGHRYAYYGYHHNPVAAGATAVVGGIADLGSIAAYPVYCFPNYGSCPVYLPY